MSRSSGMIKLRKTNINIHLKNIILKIVARR